MESIKKIYSQPKAKIIVVDNCDIIATSPGSGDAGADLGHLGEED